MLTTASKDSRYRRNRRARGLCGYSGCKEHTGDASYYCEPHAVKHANWVARSKAKARAA